MSGLPSMLDSTREELRRLIIHGSSSPELQIYRLRDALGLDELDLRSIDRLSQHDGIRAIAVLNRQ